MVSLLRALIVWWAVSTPVADAGPPDPQAATRTARDLLAAARAHTLDTAWIHARVDPGPAGWTTGRDEAWQHALRDDGPALAVIRAARGVLHTAPIDGTSARVVLDSAPRLALRIATDGRIRAIAPTACGRCSEPERWVRDHLAALRAMPDDHTRVRVGTDVDVAATLDATRSLRTHRWASLLDRRLHDDDTLRRQIAAAVVVEVAGPDVTVRYPDGRLDRWRVRFREGRGHLEYGALRADSPLRTSITEARHYRGTSHRRTVRTEAWAPSWRPTPDGLGMEIGHGAVGVALDPGDETVLVVVITLDRTVASVFRVDPWTRSVVESIPLPVPSSRRFLPVPDWTRRWPVALSPDARHLAVSTPAGLAIVDLETGEVDDRGRTMWAITALAWLDADTPVLGFDNGHLRIDGESHPVTDSAILAIEALPSGELELATARGQVLAIAPEGARHLDTVSAQTLAWVCPAGADTARRDVASGAWILHCGHGVDRALQAVDGVVGEITPSPHDLPWTHAVWQGTAPGGDALVGLSAHGQVGWWDRARLAAHRHGAEQEAAE